MRKKIILAVLVLFTAMMVTTVTIYGQRNQTLAPNVPEWIVGTWVDQDGKKWVFNADGTCSGVFGGIRYAIVEKVLVVTNELTNPLTRAKYVSASRYYYYLSDDKNTLVVETLTLGVCNWLTKQ